MRPKIRLMLVSRSPAWTREMRMVLQVRGYDVRECLDADDVAALRSLDETFGAVVVLLPSRVEVEESRMEEEYHCGTTPVVLVRAKTPAALFLEAIRLASGKRRGPRTPPRPPFVRLVEPAGMRTLGRVA